MTITVVIIRLVVVIGAIIVVVSTIAAVVVRIPVSNEFFSFYEFSAFFKGFLILNEFPELNISEQFFAIT
jgi:hypothetical protein